jgi:hypothetical protein
MKKIIGIFALSALLFACDTTDETSLSGRTDTIYIAETGNSVINITNQNVQNATFDVQVSNRTSSDRFFDVLVDDSSTAIEGTYTIDTATLKIPANQLSGTVTINGNYDNTLQPSTGSELLVLNLTGLDGLQTTNPETVLTKKQVTVTINRDCINPVELPSDLFVGSYTLTELTATVGPANDSEGFESGTVTLSIDPTNANTRSFEAIFLPAFFTTAYTYSITFDTEKVSLEDWSFGGPLCGGPGDFEYTSGGSNDTDWISCNGDNSIIINYVEDPNGNCGGPYESS